MKQVLFAASLLVTLVVFGVSGIAISLVVSFVGSLLVGPLATLLAGL